MERNSVDYFEDWSKLKILAEIDSPLDLDNFLLIFEDWVKGPFVEI